MIKNKNLEDKTILITGGAGFIGSNLACKIYNSNPKEIIIVDSFVPGLGGNIKNISEINSTVYKGAEGDIRSIKNMKPLIERADYIFNLAGSIQHLSPNEKNLILDIEGNLIPHIYFLEACRQVLEEKKDKFLSLIFSGTRDQYGKITKKNLPVNEEFIPKELTDYQSINKISAEAYHFLFHSLMKDRYTKNFHVNSVRMVNTYGPKQNLNSGAVIPTFFKNFLENKPIELWGGGEVLRDFNYVDDVTDALILLATSEDSDTYNLGCCIGKEGMNHPIGGNLDTLKNIAYFLKNIVGKGEIKEIPYPSDRANIEPGHCCSDITKIYEKFNWTPKVSLQEGLTKTYNFYK